MKYLIILSVSLSMNLFAKHENLGAIVLSECNQKQQNFINKLNKKKENLGHAYVCSLLPTLFNEVTASDIEALGLEENVLIAISKRACNKIEENSKKIDIEKLANNTSKEMIDYLIKNCDK